MRFRDETEEERALRIALEERRREAEEMIPLLEKMRPHIEHNPEAIAKWQQTLDAAKKFLSDDARERNLGDLN